MRVFHRTIATTLTLIACLLFAGCRKGDSARLPSEQPVADTPGPTTNCSLIFRILDTTDIPCKLELSNHAATIHAEGTVDTFNLKDESWLDGQTGATVRLSDAKAKFAQAADLASVMSKSNSYVAWSYQPRFEISQEGNVVSFVSGRMNCRIEVEPPRPDQARLFRYLRLSTFKNALTEKISPRPLCFVYDEIERRNLFPRRIQIAYPGLEGGSPEYSVEYRVEAWQTVDSSTGDGR